MQGDVVIKDGKGNILWSGNATNIPLNIECESYIGTQKFVIRYSYPEDQLKRGFKDRTKVKGLVMMRQG